MKKGGGFEVVVLSVFLIALATQAKTARSPEEVRAFMRLHPCPSTHAKHPPCPGWVVDHIIPLACDGPDKPSNMMWQTVVDGKAKDKWERKDCSIWNQNKKQSLE